MTDVRSQVDQVGTRARAVMSASYIGMDLPTYLGITILSFSPRDPPPPSRRS